MRHAQGRIDVSVIAPAERLTQTTPISFMQVRRALHMDRKRSFSDSPNVVIGRVLREIGHPVPLREARYGLHVVR